MKKYISILVVALTCAVSCKDFLVEEPPLDQSDVLTLSTYKGLNLAVAGASASISSGSWYGKNMILRPEMATNGKKFIGTAYDTGRLNDYYNINYRASNTSGLWGTAYGMIAQVNRIMENLEGKGEPQDLNNLKAECLFLRAIAHFDLARVYARPYVFTADASHPGVPVMTKYEDPGSASKPERATVKAVYDAVIADLLEAEKIIDPNYQRAGVLDPKATITLPVIQALLCRVYQYCENWEKCAEYATKVIDSGKYTMWTAEDLKDASCFRKDVPEGGEIIFEIYDRNTNSSFLGNEGLSFSTNPDGYPDAGSSQELFDLYSDGDVRKTLFRTQTNAKGESGMWTIKYAGKGMATPDYNNIVIFRLSEMYLNRAEAGFHGVKGINSVADLKKVTANRGAGTTGSLEGVYQERRKEFAWEGLYWFDLYRLQRGLTRGEDYIGDKSGKSLEPSDHRWVQAIPVRELEQNENLVQNEEYQSK